MYLENPGDYDKLNAFVGSEKQTLVVVGAPGVGKSALLANWKDVCAKTFPNVRTITHYVGASEKSDLPANILRRLTGAVAPIIATEGDWRLDLSPGNKTLDDFSNDFSEAVYQYLKDNPEERLIFVVDGLERLTDMNREQYVENLDEKQLRWLPELPKRAQYILTTISSDRSFAAIKRRGGERYEIGELDETRRVKLIEEFLKSRDKTPTTEQIKRIYERLFGTF